MYETTAMATTVRITPVSQRPRLLSVSSVDSRGSPLPSFSQPHQMSPFTHRGITDTSRSDSFSHTIPSPKGIKLPHTRYMPIRSQSSTAVPTISHSPSRPPLHRAPHSALAASTSLSSSPRSDDEELWSRPLGNYSFCNSYEATCSSPASASRSGSRQSDRSKSSSTTPGAGSHSGTASRGRKSKAHGRSDSECEHIGSWFKKLWRR